MDHVFCKDKKDFCDGIKDCTECEFAKGNGVISGYIARDVLATLFGLDYDLDRLRELVEADREGRVKIHPKAENNTCGACGHFHRIAGLRCGTCDVQSKYKDRYGREEERRGTFTPSQSRKACKKYIQKGEQNERSV